MFKCHCGKEFNSQRAVNAHQVSHKDRSNRYEVSRKKLQVQLHKCRYCKNEIKHCNQTTNKFCSLECFAKYQWEHVSIPKIKKGQGGNYKRYLKETRGDKCEECNQNNSWNNKPLMLQLDHIDGNSDNNNLTNLRLLCPNCHSQTETYGNAGKGSRYKKITKRNKYLQEYKMGR